MFPANAGMNRIRMSSNSARVRVPRERGDESAPYVDPGRSLMRPNEVLHENDSWARIA